MSKFIRTKDGRIIDTEKEYQPLQWAEQARDYALTIAEADTIEELCDMTIVVDDERPNNIFELAYGIDKEIINKYKDIDGVIVYTAIWTDKGLIYVAKLNEKGELELI